MTDQMMGDARFTGPDRVYAFADSVQQDADAATAVAERAAQWETWVAFALADETYALPVASVQEILRVGTITRVPDAPYPVRGILNLRGRVVPVVDLRLRLGLKPQDTGARARILVSLARGRTVGLLVDSVEQVVRLDHDRFEAPPADIVTAAANYLHALYQRDRGLLVLLDAERVLDVTAGADAPVELI